MNLMAWSDHFVTGIDPVDQQHRMLVNMINAAAPHLVSGDDEAQREVGPLLDKLIQYAATHFKYEEMLMEQVHVEAAYLAQHVKTHLAFVDEVLRMRTQFERGEHLSGNDLLHFLTSWLTFHILSEDKQMARQILAIRAGDSASHAYAALDAPASAPQAVYNAALIDLFALLTTRNRNLTAANEEIRQGKTELERLNQELEQRVSQRTQELAASNAELRTERLALVDSLAQLKLTQNQLLQSEKMAAVGQLAAGVAHEINNPIGFVSSNLGSLSGYVNQLLAFIRGCETLAPALPPAQRNALLQQAAAIDLPFIRQDVSELLQESRAGLDRVKRIVNDLRDYAGADNAVWQSADINTALQNALKVTDIELQAKAEVRLELAPIPPLLCIPAQIGQVFVNLLRNAAQAIAEHGTITLRSGCHGDTAWIDISDTGCGMSAATQRRIFEPFFTTHAVGNGTGLGLTMAWDIIKRHSGSLDVKSVPDQGTTFHIELPIRAASTTPAGTP